MRGWTCGPEPTHPPTRPPSQCSGGFRELCLPIARELGVPPRCLFANRMNWQVDDDSGARLGWSAAWLCWARRRLPPAPRKHDGLRHGEAMLRCRVRPAAARLLFLHPPLPAHALAAARPAGMPTRLVGFDAREPTGHQMGKPRAIAHLRQLYPYDTVRSF